MGVEKNIVVFELGSSSIRAIVGQKKPDGSLQVLGYEKESAPDSIHKGVVYNIDKTIQAITNITKRIEARQAVYVNRAYVGISGQSLRTVANSVNRQFDIKATVTDEILDSLMDENRTRTYPGAEILDVLPQDYRVGTIMNPDPKGVMTDRIEGYYKNVIARTNLREGISHCMDGAHLEVADYFISPLLLANYLLTDTEKRSGCALVDFGAETTTVAVYSHNVLRHLVVLPLGGNTITADIASTFHIEHEEAENLKRTYGSAYTEEEDVKAARTINISNDRTIDEKRLLNIVEARQQEIIDNVWEQIKDYQDRLLAGIIFTGGAANMPNLETAFKQYHHFDKLKVRFMPSTPDFTTSLKLDPKENTLATLIAMLRRGDQECTSEKPAEPDLFDNENRDTDNAAANAAANRQAGEGVVNKEQPKDEETKTGEEAHEQTATPPQPQKPGFFKRMGKRFSDLAAKLVDESADENDRKK